MLPMNHVPTIRPSPARKRLAGKNIASALDVDIAGTPSQTHLARSGAHHRRDEDLSSSTTRSAASSKRRTCRIRCSGTSRSRAAPDDSAVHPRGTEPVPFCNPVH